jgi:hypothetical protein
MALETITLTNVYGQTITFGDASLPNVLYKGFMGGGLAPVDNFVVDTAYQPGASFVRTKKKPTVITIRLVVQGRDNQSDPRQDLWNTLDTVLKVLDPQIGATSTLVKTTSDGAQRQLNTVQYVGGFEVDDKAENRAYVTVDLVFEAYDPNWYSPSVHSSYLGSATDTFGFVVPVTFTGVAPNAVFVIGSPATGSGVLTNAGNIYTFPTFTFIGPCANYEIRNATTGQSFLITKQLFSGDTMVVDTKNGVLTFTPSGGAATPFYSAFAGAKQWVQLAPGGNTISFTRDVAASQQCLVQWQDTWNHG